MFAKHTTGAYTQALPGVERKTLVYGERTLLTEFRLQAGSQLPQHSHPHEQTGYLVKGRCRFTIGMEAFDVAPGDSWCIPKNVEHGVQVLEDAVAVEVFSPVRTDYLPKAALSG